MLESDTPSKTFLGVRFCLYGFDPVNEHKVRVKLISGGGVGVGQYNHNCTHLIVDKIVHDDPVCVAAINDGKTVVTGLWVDHSFDIGMPVDVTSIIYRPLKDLYGIPGAKRLIICLTGYQRQDREDIMTMVRLMGAQFCKPLVSNKVTHLICYKFEGEKYALAKKTRTIKFVNHRWLEDCLREWALLSEATYSTSGHDLEVMEAVVEDSDEEAEEATLKHSGQKSLNRSPHNSKAAMLSSSEFPSTVEVSTSKMPRHSPNTKEVLLTPGNSHSDASFNSVKVPEHYAFQDSGLRNISSIKLAQPDTRSSNSTNMDNNLASSSKTPSLSNQMFTGISYSRKTRRISPRKATSPNLPGEVSGNISGSPQAMKIMEVYDISSSKMQQSEEKTCSSLVRSPKEGSALRLVEDSTGILPQKRALEKTCSSLVRSPKEGSALRLVEDSTGILPQKRALELSGSSSKSSTTSHYAKASTKDSALDTGRLDPTSFSGDQPLINDYSVNETGYPNVLNSSSEATVCFSSKTVTPEDRQNDSEEKSPNMSFRGYSVNEADYPKVLSSSSAGNAATKLSTDRFPSKTLTIEDRQNSSEEKAPILSFRGSTGSPLASKPDMRSENAYEKSPQMSSKGLREPTSTSISNIGDYGLEQFVKVVGEPGEAQNKPQDVELTSLDRNPGKKDYLKPSNLDVLEGENDKSVTKPVSKKKLAKKTLGSRSKLSNTANRKGSIRSSKIASETHSTIYLDGDNERATHTSATKLETCSPAISLDAAKDVEVTNCQNTAASKTHLMDDETQAPDKEDSNDSKKTAGKEKSELVESTHKADILVEGEHVRHYSKVTVHRSPIASRNRTDHGADPVRAVGVKISEFGEPTIKFGGLEKKVNKRNKQLTSRARVKAVPSNSKNDMVGENTSVEKNVEGKENGKENLMQHPDAKPSSNNASSKADVSGAAHNSIAVCHKEIAGNSVGKPNNRTVKINEKFQKVDSNRQPLQKVFNRVKTQPLCFILSGHRLQRKEFQQVIRGLKGKFCRDSHQWSYQATHFIAPDPIRRTEKFFAAAASGRWILKPDFLSACNQAGKFLAEEPYEWHKNGLSEDGTINLEAPRKWRQVRERTGHGAFYGMRIVVYGECIAPPLDTLKRVVKAGDGDLLATSPPYTKFLKSGVDFAVVSPGMPRVDMWVQEFIKHEVPCIVADYLVEYVCKPGYSLDKHVLYNTHEWAEKSFTKLTGQAEEIVEDSTVPQPPDDSESNDITCEVCGSANGGEVMLICGDENGSVGCGIGTHIDCCDPPLDNIPEDDWFCPKCSGKSLNNTSSRKRKKGTSQSKGK